MKEGLTQTCLTRDCPNFIEKLDQGNHPLQEILEAPCQKGIYDIQQNEQ